MRRISAQKLSVRCVTWLCHNQVTHASDGTDSIDLVRVPPFFRNFVPLRDVPGSAIFFISQTLLEPRIFIPTVFNNFVSDLRSIGLSKRFHHDLPQSRVCQVLCTSVLIFRLLRVQANSSLCSQHSLLRILLLCQSLQCCSADTTCCAPSVLFAT